MYYYGESEINIIVDFMSGLGFEPEDIGLFVEKIPKTKLKDKLIKEILNFKYKNIEDDNAINRTGIAVEEHIEAFKNEPPLSDIKAIIDHAKKIIFADETTKKQQNFLARKNWKDADKRTSAEDFLRKSIFERDRLMESFLTRLGKFYFKGGTNEQKT